MSSVKSFSLEESKICCLGKGYENLRLFENGLRYTLKHLFIPLQGDLIREYLFLNHTNDEVLDLPRLNPFAMSICPGMHRKRNCGKRRKCWLPAFSSFPTRFSKASYLWIVKTSQLLRETCIIPLRAHVASL